MISITKFSIICSVILMILIHPVHQLEELEVLGTEYEGSDEIKFEGMESNSTLAEVTEYSDTTPEDNTSSPNHSTSSTTTTTPKTSTTEDCIPEVVRPSSMTSTTVSMISCNSDGSYNGEYDIDVWPPVPIGEKSQAPCIGILSKGYAYWKCLETGQFDEMGPDLSNCTDWLDELENMDDITRIGEAILIIEIISNNTIETESIQESEKLTKVLNIMSKVQTFVDNAKDTDLRKLEKYANSIFETYTHIMDQKKAWVNSTADEKANLASMILIGTQSSSYSLSLHQNSTQKVVEIQNNDFYINTFYTDSSHELKFPSEEKNNNYSTIFIPPNTTFVNSTVERNNTAVGAIIRNLKGLSANLEEYHEINSDILSFSLTNSTERLLLTQDVIITLKHKHRLQFGDKVDCVFWDFNQSKWSSEGCYLMANESDLLHTVCKCNHLTNFAAIMDVQGRESKTLVKSLLTYFCSIISIFGLMFTINLIIRSKNNPQNDLITGNIREMRSIITCNLCICLMITNVLVIAGMDRTDILWLCQMSSALLLYSLLTSFSWMLMEGYYLYKSLVCCFNAEYKTLNLYLLGYGLPVVIFIIAFIVIYIKENILLEALFDERYNYFCWISSSHYRSHIWILIGPAVCVIVCNCILMYISLRTAFKILRNQSSFGMNTDRTKIKFRQIISFVSILFLLGITWMSFLFYIHQFFTAVFAYVFIVLNGSQGFFIFLYHLSIYDFKGNRRTDLVNSSQSKLVP